MRTPAPTKNPPQLHPIPRSGQRLGGLFSRQQTYDFLNSGLLVAVRVGRQVLVTDESLQALPSKLPAYRPDAERSERMASLRRGAKAAASKRSTGRRDRSGRKVPAAEAA